MKLRGWIMASLLFSACAQVPERPVPLSEQAPEVLFVVPEPGETLPLPPRMAVFFSRPIDPSTLGADSVLLARGEVDPEGFGNPSGLLKAIDEGDLAGVTLDFAPQKDGKTVIFSPRDPLLPQESYTLLVTSRVSSPDRIPVATFLAVYRTLEGDFDPELDQILAEAEEEEEEGLPEEAPPESSGEDPRPISEEPPVPGRVVLNEIFYDAVGSDTDGILFVELYGTPGMALGGFRIVFVDGGDGSVDDSITLPGEAEIGADGFYLVADSGTGQAASEVSGADLVDNFDPQNGPDAVQLLDSLGELADAVAYGNGVVPLAENGLAAFEGTAAPDVINGHSLERREPGLDIDNNLADFVDREAPSPGR